MTAAAHAFDAGTRARWHAPRCGVCREFEDHPQHEIERLRARLAEVEAESDRRSREVNIWHTEAQRLAARVTVLEADARSTGAADAVRAQTLIEAAELVEAADGQPRIAIACQLRQLARGSA